MKPRFRLVSAVHLFLLDPERILLLRRKNTGYEDGKYSVIAGHLEGDETVFEAAQREALEEASIRPLDLEVVGVMHRRAEDERIDWFVAARAWQGEIRIAEADRCDDLAWFELDALPENTIPYIRRAIENFRRGQWYDSFGWAHQTDEERHPRPRGP